MRLQPRRLYTTAALVGALTAVLPLTTASSAPAREAAPTPSSATAGSSPTGFTAPAGSGFGSKAAGATSTVASFVHWAAGARVSSSHSTSFAGVVASGPDGTGLHWLMRPGQHTLVVDVVDSTGWSWPVRAASGDWTTPHVRYSYAPSCRAGVPCVEVHEGAYGPTGWSGLTTATSGQMQTFTGSVQIQLNDSYRMSAAERRAVTCHELGHALGLDHDPRTDSCLQSIPHALHPDATDLEGLEARYRTGG